MPATFPALPAVAVAAVASEEAVTIGRVFLLLLLRVDGVSVCKS